tara:strand:- start:410 stop:526 length:117 start_codon:yes stop_codon:yes gene_type:complete
MLEGGGEVDGGDVEGGEYVDVRFLVGGANGSNEEEEEE